ncbi:YhcN/YlaJ family sporulation lipoprotein [Bacillus solimangrovi]|uniref:Sporulation protein n=1 Tax=Bacillus solimangrovi TaxID=1305675 RepID=A0A1E5LC47_9BACI|nr:YhcN/YlaJ family sporulation lipoprotein [Bacillus solimangrovi]OEH91660.1 hypothetical protein BFG57_04625 [Bacillus solimangrovi]
MVVRCGLSLLLMLLIFSGCQQGAQQSTEKHNAPLQVNVEQNKWTNEMKTIQAVRDIVLPMKQVLKMKTVAYEKDIIVVLELKHLYTFRSERIIKQAKEKIKKEFPKKKVKVTTDHKIYIELEKLQKKMEDNQISEKELKKELKNVKKLLKQT